MRLIWTTADSKRKSRRGFATKFETGCDENNLPAVEAFLITHSCWRMTHLHDEDKRDMNNDDSADDTDPVVAALAHQKELQEAGESLEKRRQQSFVRLERFVCKAVQLWQSCNSVTDSTNGRAAVKSVSDSIMNFAACMRDEGWNERIETGPHPLPDDAIIERNPDGTVRTVVLSGRPPHTYRVVESLFPGSYGETLVGPLSVIITYDSIDYMRSQNHPSKQLEAEP